MIIGIFCYNKQSTTSLNMCAIRNYNSIQYENHYCLNLWLLIVIVGTILCGYILQYGSVKMFAILILHSLILHSGDNIEVLSNPTYTHTHTYKCTHIHTYTYVHTYTHTYAGNIMGWSWGCTVPIGCKYKMNCICAVLSKLKFKLHNKWWPCVYLLNLAMYISWCPSSQLYNS